jgi:hypothetical protein
VPQKPHVQPERAEDPSDQKFYTMAADRQNKVIDLENRADSLRQSIDVLGTAGGYATTAMRAELDEVDEELQRYQPAAKPVPGDARCNELQLSGARTANIGHFPTELFATIRSSKTGLSATVTTLFATEPQSLASNHII